MALIDQRVEKVLCDRYIESLSNFIHEFVSYDEHSLTNDEENYMINEPSSHEILIRDSLIVVEPPINWSRSYWLGEILKNLSILCTQDRIKLKDDKLSEKDYQYLADKADQNVVTEKYQALWEIMEECNNYCQSWSN